MEERNVKIVRDPRKSHLSKLNSIILKISMWRDLIKMHGSEFS